MPQGQGQTQIAIAEATAIPNGDNSGVATLVAGTVNVAFPRATTSTRVFVTMRTPIGTALTTEYQHFATGAGVNFTLQANIAAGTINVADGSTLNWFAIP